MGQESGTDIIGKSGTELRQLEESNPPQFEEVMLQTQHKAFVFKIKVHEESWNDETRIKQTILRYFRVLGLTFLLLLLEKGTPFPPLDHCPLILALCPYFRVL